MSERQSVTVTCDCGHEFKSEQEETQGFGVEEGMTILMYPVCELECPKCARRASGGDCITGEITHWTTQAEIYASEQEYQRQLFDSDMNEMYGRGEW